MSWSSGLSSVARAIVTRLVQGRLGSGLIVRGYLPIRSINALELAEAGALSIGRDLALQRGTRLAVRSGARLRLGDDVFIGHNSVIVCRDSIVIGDGVLLGPNVVIFDHDHDIASKDLRSSFVTGAIEVGDGAWLGAGVAVLRGVRIGSGAVVGANSVVTRDVPPWTISVGAPARVVGHRQRP